MTVEENCSSTVFRTHSNLDFLSSEEISTLDCYIASNLQHCFSVPYFW